MSAAVATTARADLTGRIRPGEAIRHALVIARRNLLHIRSDPEQLVGMTIQPLMFLVLFVFVFGGAIAGSSQQYLQYALPGILIQGITFTGFQTALGLNVDFQRGLIDRFRSLPIARSAVVGGRILADSVRVVWGVLIITGFGVLLGFRLHRHRRQDAGVREHLGLHDHPAPHVRQLGVRSAVVHARLAGRLREDQPDHEGGRRHPWAHVGRPSGQAAHPVPAVDGGHHRGVRSSGHQPLPSPPLEGSPCRTTTEPSTPASW
jgi:hypothetical protein